DRVNAILLAARALNQLQRITGEKPLPSMRAILNSSHWRQVEGAMRDALGETWPDAMAAIDDAIAKLYADDPDAVVWDSPVREFTASPGAAIGPAPPAQARDRAPRRTS